MSFLVCQMCVFIVVTFSLWASYGSILVLRMNRRVTTHTAVYLCSKYAVVYLCSEYAAVYCSSVKVIARCVAILEGMTLYKPWYNTPQACLPWLFYEIEGLRLEHWWIDSKFRCLDYSFLACFVPPCHSRTENNHVILTIVVLPT